MIDELDLEAEAVACFCAVQRRREIEATVAMEHVFGAPMLRRARRVEDVPTDGTENGRCADG